MSDQPRQLTHVAYTVTAADTEAAAALPTRTYLLLINDSDETIYVKFDVAAGLNEGIRLNAAGGSAEFSARNGNLDTRAVRAISATGTKVLLITEA